MTDPSLFIYANAGRAVEFKFEDLPAGARDASKVFRPEHTDYDYVSGLTDDAKPEWVLLFDKTSHPGGMRNVVKLGGQVVSVSEVELKQAIESTLREARRAGHDAQVWGLEQ